MIVTTHTTTTNRLLRLPGNSITNHTTTAATTAGTTRIRTPLTEQRTGTMRVSTNNNNNNNNNNNSSSSSSMLPLLAPPSGRAITATKATLTAWTSMEGTLVGCSCLRWFGRSFVHPVSRVPATHGCTLWRHKRCGGGCCLWSLPVLPCRYYAEDGSYVAAEKAAYNVADADGWMLCQTEDGYDYYYNEVTNDSQWEPPPSYQDAAAAAGDSAAAAVVTTTAAPATESVPNLGVGGAEATPHHQHHQHQHQQPVQRRHQQQPLQPEQEGRVASQVGASAAATGSVGLARGSTSLPPSPTTTNVAHRRSGTSPSPSPSLSGTRRAVLSPVSPTASASSPRAVDSKTYRAPPSNYSSSGGRSPTAASSSSAGRRREKYTPSPSLSPVASPGTKSSFRTAQQQPRPQPQPQPQFSNNDVGRASTSTGEPVNVSPRCVRARTVGVIFCLRALCYG